MNKDNAILKYNSIRIVCALLLGAIIGIIISQLFIPTIKYNIIVPEKGNYTFDTGPNMLKLMELAKGQSDGSLMYNNDFPDYSDNLSQKIDYANCMLLATTFNEAGAAIAHQTCYEGIFHKPAYNHTTITQLPTNYSHPNQIKTSYTHYCYPKECEGLYNNSGCDPSCQYLVYCSNNETQPIFVGQ